MNSALHADAVIWQIIQSAAAMSLYRPLKTKKNQDFQNLEIDLCLFIPDYEKLRCRWNSRTEFVKKFGIAAQEIHLNEQNL